MNYCSHLFFFLLLILQNVKEIEYTLTLLYTISYYLIILMDLPLLFDLNKFENSVNNINLFYFLLPKNYLTQLVRTVRWCKLINDQSFINFFWWDHHVNKYISITWVEVIFVSWKKKMHFILFKEEGVVFGCWPPTMNI